MSFNNKETFIKKVMNSCVNYDQLKSVEKWLERIKFKNIFISHLLGIKKARYWHNERLNPTFD